MEPLGEFSVASGSSSASTWKSSAETATLDFPLTQAPTTASAQQDVAQFLLVGKAVGSLEGYACALAGTAIATGGGPGVSKAGAGGEHEGVHPLRGVNGIRGIGEHDLSIMEDDGATWFVGVSGGCEGSFLREDDTKTSPHGPRRGELVCTATPFWVSFAVATVTSRAAGIEAEVERTTAAATAVLGAQAERTMTGLTGETFLEC